MRVTVGARWAWTRACVGVCGRVWACVGVRVLSAWAWRHVQRVHMCGGVLSCMGVGGAPLRATTVGRCRALHNRLAWAHGACCESKIQ